MSGYNHDENCACATCIRDEKRQGMGWVSVEDRFPEDGERVLVVWDGEVDTLIYDADDNTYLNVFDEIINPWFITHWMSLPEPPKEDK